MVHCTRMPKFILLLFVVFSVCSSCTAGRSTTTSQENDETRWISRPVIDFPLNSRKYYPILSLDGGGLRGIITTEILLELEDSIKRHIVDKKYPIQSKKYERHTEIMRSVSEFEIDIADYFQTIAGVSAGSWIATYLASKGGNGACDQVFQDKGIRSQFGDIRCGAVEGLRVYFLRYGQEIYPPPLLKYTVFPRFLGLPKVMIAGINSPSYKHTGLEDVLDRFLGDTVMMNVHATLFVHTYDLIRRATVLFIGDPSTSPPHTSTYVFRTTTMPRDPTEDAWRPTVKLLKNKHYKLKEITRASSAAPTIHAAKRFGAINDESCVFYCIDGAMMANNPTFQTIVFLAEEHRVGNLGKMAIFSIGMGISAGEFRKHGQGGALQWLLVSQDFLSIVMDGGSELIQAQVDVFFYKSLAGLVQPGQYLRIQTAYDKSTHEGQVLSDMTDYKNVYELQKIGKITANEFTAAIARFVRTFLIVPADNETVAEPSVPVAASYQRRYPAEMTI